jgi:hypothetical protein
MEGDAEQIIGRQPQTATLKPSQKRRFMGQLN